MRRAGGGGLRLPVRAAAGPARRPTGRPERHSGRRRLAPRRARIRPLRLGQSAAAGQGPARMSDALAPADEAVRKRRLGLRDEEGKGVEVI